MRNPTELMQRILKSKSAQQFIDYVSPIYGDSYVGLWLYEVMGKELDGVAEIVEALKTEANPTTAVLLLDYWEDFYRLPRAPHLSVVQRQARIEAAIKQRGPCNPNNLAALVSATLGGIETDITENIAKNTFMVNMHEFVDTPGALDAVRAALDRRKPAHLIYILHFMLEIASYMDMKIAVASMSAETDSYCVEVQQYSEKYELNSQMKTAVAITSADIYRVEVT